MFIVVLGISILVVKWLGLGIEQVKLNEPALPKRHDKYFKASNKPFGCPSVLRAVSTPSPGPSRLDISPRNLGFRFLGMFLRTLRKLAFDAM